MAARTSYKELAAKLEKRVKDLEDEVTRLQDDLQHARKSEAEANKISKKAVKLLESSVNEIDELKKKVEELEAQKAQSFDESKFFKVDRYKNRNGRPKRQLTDAEKKKIKKMRTAGRKSIKTISAEMHISDRVISAFLKI